MRLRRVVIISGAAITAAFGIYLWSLYGQLKTAFSRQEQFVPTRIYSDVTRIAPPQPRGEIEEKLRSLAYSLNRDGESVSFTLHPLEYPIYLLPDNHPTIEAFNKIITLRFTGEGADSSLHAIELEGTEIPELYLEPELVATLARPGEGKKQIRELVKLEEIPAPIWKAIIAIEDQHFLDHKGLDPRGIARAIFVNLKTLSLAQGGSTITQQLVKNLMARRNKNIVRKVNEVFLSLLLEMTFEKDQILERYLNEVYLGQVGNLEIHGVAEGAKYFFGKNIDELNLAEIALMAGLIRGPGFYSPYRHNERAMERQRLVLKKMVETGQIAQGEADAALRLPVRLAPAQTTTNKAPYFTDYVKAELLQLDSVKGRIAEPELAEAGLRVYTTLDLSLNQYAQQAVANGVADLEKKLGSTLPAERLEGALVSVDHSTGFVRALVGGRSYAQSTFNRILNMKRQVGSTFKPIVYLTALEKGYDAKGISYGPAHPIEDAPWTLVYDRGKQTWEPKNYEKEHRGWTTYRTALAHSINTTTAKLAWEIGLNPIIETARRLGIESDLPAVPSLSLGVAELSLIELTRVYSVFANHGAVLGPAVIRGITHDDGDNFHRPVYVPKTVVDAASIDLLTDMLQSIFTEGTARDAHRLGFDRPAAGKTGTTSHHRDSWFAGYTPQLTTVVWVGMDQPPSTEKSVGKKKKKIALTGATSALPIWVNYTQRALAGEPPLTFAVSPDLLTLPIDQYTGEQAAPDCRGPQVIHDKYIRGRDPKRFSCETSYPAPVRRTVANE